MAHVLYGHNQKSGRNEVLGMLGGAAIGLAGIAATGVYNTQMQDMTNSFMETGASFGRTAYSPEMELEADHFGIFAMKEAGYNSEKGGKAFLRMARRFDGDHRLAVWQEGIATMRRGQSAPITTAYAEHLQQVSQADTFW